MKNQALFSSKDTSKKLKCRLLQFLFGALRGELAHTACSQRGWDLLKQGAHQRTCWREVSRVLGVWYGKLNAQ